MADNLNDSFKMSYFPSLPRLSMPGEVGTPPSPSVCLFAIFVAILLFTLAFATDRKADIDEVGLLNPPYMYVHYGRLTYPIYRYPDSMVVHPPLHTWMIGYLWRHGFTIYYAEAAVPAVLLALTLISVVFARFPSVLKLSLLFGLALPFAFARQMGWATFGTRPETHVVAAWLLGLVLLEWGRLDGWKPGKLFLGSFFVVYTAGLHYYAAASALTALVYMGWAISHLGWRRARTPLMAISLGGLLFGIPYLALFVVPHFREIADFVRLAQGGGGIPEAIRTHIGIYKYLAYNLAGLPWVTWPVGHFIPLVLLSAVLALLFRPAAGLVLAAQPLELFVILFARHKLFVYCFHELIIYAVLLAGTVLALFYNLWIRVHARSAHILFLPVASLALAIPLLKPNPLSNASISLELKVHEVEIARSATRDILGPGARVAGRLALWYVSGGASWYGVSPDLLWTTHLSVNLEDYLSMFDAVAESENGSEITSNDARATISSWYRDGLLKLRGFYFGESSELKFVLLSTHPPAHLVGYGLRIGTLYRFDEHPEGNYQLVAVACPVGAEINRLFRQAPFSSMLDLPPATPGAPSSGSLVTAILPYQEDRALPRPDCRLVSDKRVVISLCDWRGMVGQLRSHDPSIHFPQFLDELPGYQGIGVTNTEDPPAESITLTKVIDIHEVKKSSDQTSLDLANGVKITTTEGLGTFSASIPIHRGNSVIGSCWVHVRARVLAGRIGIGTWSVAAQRLLFQEPVILKNQKAVDIYLPVLSLRDADDIIIYSGLTNARSHVDIQAADVIVSKQQWLRNREILGAFR